MTIRVKRFATGRLQANCYVVNDESLNSVIIDPGSDPDNILQYVGAQNLCVKGLLATHGDFDHVGAVPKLQEHLAVPFYLHSRDQKILKQANLYTYFIEHRIVQEQLIIDRVLDDLQVLSICNFELHIYQTPGHTPGSVCFLIDDHLFTGDTLFATRIGTTASPWSNRSALQQSLRLLGSFSPQILLCPGHGRTVALEMALLNNKQLRAMLND